MSINRSQENMARYKNMKNQIKKVVADALSFEYVG